MIHANGLRLNARPAFYINCFTEDIILFIQTCCFTEVISGLLFRRCYMHQKSPSFLKGLGAFNFFNFHHPLLAGSKYVFPCQSFL